MFDSMNLRKEILTAQAKKNIENKVDKEREKVYKKKILEWLRLNLII